MKFLILRFSSIGDIVLTTPVIRCLKKKYPEAEIHYATKKTFGTILQANPHITSLHFLENSVVKLITDLKEQKFDYVIDLHHNQRTWLIKTMLGVKSFSFNKLNFEKWLITTFMVNRLPQKHIVDRYLETCTDLNVTNDGEGLDYYLSPEDEVDTQTLPGPFRQGYIGWVTGAKQNTKKFPAEKIIKALTNIQLPVVLLGGKEDIAGAEQIMRMVQGKTIFNACGKYTLNQSASLVKQASFIISNDTGLMHIASAFRKPIVSIWGNTIPEFGMNPYFGKPANIPPGCVQLEIKDLSCRPCSKLGYSRCPQGHFNCMNLIDEQEIVSIVNESGKLDYTL